MVTFEHKRTVFLSQVFASLSAGTSALLTTNMSERRYLDPKAHKYQKNGIKSLIIGRTGVGKSTMIRKLCELNDQFLRDNRVSDKLHSLPELQYLEASLEDMPNLRPIMFEICDVFILMYAVNDEESFDFVTTIATEITQIKGEDVPMMVVANKNDVESHDVEHKMADCVVTIDFNAKHLIASTECGNGVQSVFSTILCFFGVESLSGDGKNELRRKKRSLRDKLSSIFQKKNSK